jgi:protocatechuate 3,4-dioxygenase beta subunit
MTVTEHSVRPLDPAYDHPDYRSTILRAPKQPLLPWPPGVADPAFPLLGDGRLGPLDHDLTRQHDGDPLGERITVTGRVVDGDGRPIRRQLVEIWQANSAGRYAHPVDQHPAPLDPNFTGAGRCLTDDHGTYRFVTVKPGAYPWGNHPNAWRPAHIHFSLFGTLLSHRLITQMYFPGDPLFAFDPVMQAVRDPAARQRMVSTFELDLTEPEWALGYRFDIVLSGRQATPFQP